MIENNKVRDNRFDFYKGFLMLGVIWGHTITNLLCGEYNSVSIHWIMRTYDMPFFMIISGYFLSLSLVKKSQSQMFLDKVTTILIPTIFWSFIYSLGTSLTEYYFLWAVFWSSSLAILLSLITNRMMQMICAAVITFIFHLIDSPLSNLSYLFPFFILGYFQVLICKGKLRFQEKSGWNLFMALIFIILLCIWKSDYSIWNTSGYILSDFGFKLIAICIRILIGVSGIYTLTWIGDVFYRQWQKKDNWFYRLMIRTGKETLAIYILQQIILFRFLKKGMEIVVNLYGYNMLTLNDRLLGYIFAPILSLLVLCVCLAVVDGIKRNNIGKYLFGFKIPQSQIYFGRH